jgi:hypothetical protein
LLRQFPIAVAAAIALSTSGCTSLLSNLGKGHCMKSTRGYDICIKPENVECEVDNVGDVKCSAFGTSTDLAGKNEHFSTSMEDNSSDDHLWCKLSGKLSNEDSFTCEAAEKFGKI